MFLLHFSNFRSILAALTVPRWAASAAPVSMRASESFADRNTESHRRLSEFRSKWSI